MAKKVNKTKEQAPSNRRLLSWPCLFLFTAAAIGLGIYTTDVKSIDDIIRRFTDSKVKQAPQKPTAIIYNGPKRILEAKLEDLDEIDQRLKKEIGHFNYDLYGPGLHNVPVKLPAELKAKSEARFGENNFDVVVSDLVSINRQLTDVRNKACQRRFTMASTPKDLPKASLIIVFHNEAFSTLIRTLHSIITRTPTYLIHEIVLVDDLSDRDWLQEPLERYIKEFPFKNIKLIRLPERSGLIKARLVASEASSGDVLLFLDAHIEVTKNWIQPLLIRVKEEPNVLVAPLIDVIDLDNFEYRTTIDGLVGAFNWRLTYSWTNIDEVENKRRGGDKAAPVKTPVIAGGLFAIRRDYFYELGTYDEDMKVWGGENVEISMRAWRCGGQLEIHPCSRVGHVFRKVTPYTFPGGVEEMISHNEIRTAKVWLDEYQPFYFNTHPFSKKVKVGSVEKRLALKDKLNCKSFRWYIKNIYRMSPFPLEYQFMGRIRSTTDNFCVDSRQQKQGKLFIAELEDFGNHQLWVLDNEGVLYNDHACIKFNGYEAEVIPFEYTKNGCARFDYNPETKQFTERSTGMCLARNNILGWLDYCSHQENTQWNVEVLVKPESTSDE